jgi:hypothetical protein
MTRVHFLVPREPDLLPMLGYQQLADQLGRLMTVTVAVDEGGPLPQAGFVLLDRFGEAVRRRGSTSFENEGEVLRELFTREERRRLILLRVSSGPATVDVVRESEVAGAIDDRDLLPGVDPERAGAGPTDLSGLYGDRAVLEQLGASISYGDDRVAKCVVLPPFARLADLLAAYLRALAG